MVASFGRPVPTLSIILNHTYDKFNERFHHLPATTMATKGKFVNCIFRKSLIIAGVSLMEQSENVVDLVIPNMCYITVITGHIDSNLNQFLTQIG